MSYISSLFQPDSYKKTVARTALVVDYISETHDNLHLVHTGLSGSLIGHPVAMALKLKSLYIRKKDQSHGLSIEPEEAHSRRSILKAPYVIIDDFMDCGGTVKRIVKKMKTTFPKCVPVGLVLYDDDNFETWDRDILESIVKHDFRVYTFWYSSKGYKEFIFNGKKWTYPKLVKRF